MCGSPHLASARVAAGTPAVLSHALSPRVDSYPQLPTLVKSRGLQVCVIGQSRSHLLSGFSRVSFVDGGLESGDWSELPIDADRASSRVVFFDTVPLASFNELFFDTVPLASSNELCFDTVPLASSNELPFIAANRKLPSRETPLPPWLASRSDSLLSWDALFNGNPVEPAEGRLATRISRVRFLSRGGFCGSSR